MKNIIALADEHQQKGTTKDIKNINKTKECDQGYKKHKMENTTKNISTKI